MNGRYRVVELFQHDRDDDPPGFDSIERAARHMGELASAAIIAGKSINLVLESHDHRVIRSVAINVFPSK